MEKTAERTPVSVRKAISLLREQTCSGELSVARLDYSRTKLRCSASVDLPAFMLVYWPEKESMTVVKRSATSIVEVGEDCQVTIRRKQYSGKVAAKGQAVIL